MLELRKKSRGVWLYILAVICTGTFIVSLRIADRIEIIPGFFAQGDFVSYYSASRTFNDRINPYDQVELSRYKDRLGLGGLQWQYYALYPPWFYLAFSPLNSFGFHKAGQIWTVISLCCLLIAGAMVWSVFSPGKFNWFLCFSLTLFYLPVHDALLEGQISLFLALSAVTSWVCIRQEKYALAGIALLIFTLKPHLGVPFGIVLLVRLVKERRYAALLAPAVFGLLLIVIPELYFPHSHSYWLTRVANGPPFTKTASLVAQIAAPLSGMFDVKWVASLLSLVCWGVIFRVCWQADTAVELDRLYPLLLAVAPAVAPYSWIADYSFGVFVQLTVVSACAAKGIKGNSEFGKIFTMVLFANIAGAGAIDLFVRRAEGFGIYLAVPLVIWFFNRRL